MNETTDASAIFAPIWRRKWLILAVALLVGIGTYLYYKRSTPLYRSTTQVYLGAGAEEQGVAEKGSSKSATASVANQVQIINSIVVPAVRQRLRRQHNKPAAKGTVKAKASEKSQFIQIAAEAHKARATALLANEVAREYIARARTNHQRALLTQLSIARRQLARIETSRASSRSGKGKSPAESTSSILQTATLHSKINQLESQLAVTTAQQVNPAKPRGAELLAPKPRQNAIFGFVIGLVLAAIAAYAVAQFDRRLRTLSGIESLLRLQVLSALPRVRRPLVVRETGQPSPSPALIEPLRRLYMTLKLGGTPGYDGQGAVRTLLFISPDPGDGKSTVVANLAMVQRDSGERVAVIDANLRRPVQAQLLRVGGAQGLTDVLEGGVPVDTALQTVHSGQHAPTYGAPPSSTGVTTVIGTGAVGALSVLTSGHEALNPPALLAADGMSELLRSLAAEYDYVLVDAASPLEVSDVMPLLHATDGIVIVSRVGHTQSPSASRLMQLLAQTPSSPVLGLVANCVTRKDLARYGFGLPDGRAARRRPARR